MIYYADIKSDFWSLVSAKYILHPLCSDSSLYSSLCLANQKHLSINFINSLWFCVRFCEPKGFKQEQ